MKVETVVATDDPLVEVTPESVERDSSEPPGWLVGLALVAAAFVVAFGLVGSFLALNGWYTAWLAFLLGTLGAVALTVVAWPVVKPARPPARAAHVVAAVGVAAILAVTAWNAAHASEHVLINRDGGSYTTTGRWIAREGNLVGKPRVGPFAKEGSVAFDSYAVYSMPNGTIEFQFAHLLPALLAEAYAVGGDRGLFHLPQLLGGVALLAFFVLAWRVIRRPWFALAAMLALAFIIPQVSFTRDSYSEIPSQILLFTALWLMVTKKLLPSARVAFVAGVFLGATQATRIDGSVFLIGVPVVFAIAWLRADPAHRARETLPAMGAFVLGLAPGLLVGFFDLINHSGKYWNDLWTSTRQLLVVVVLSAIGSFVLVVVWRYLAPFLRRLPWRPIATAAAVFTAVIGFAAWVVRPRIQHMRTAPLGLVASLQAAEHVAVDPTRDYYERSMQWMSWYLGPLTLAAAIIGAALLVRALILGHRMRVFAPLAVIVPGSMLYLWKASAAPDQVWVDRRFLVSAFPVLILLALGLAAYMWAQRGRGASRAALRVGGVVIAVIAVGFPAYTLRDVSAMSEKRGFVDVINDTCKAMGPNAAAILLEDKRFDLFDDWSPQAFRAWCGANVGITRGTAKTADLKRLAREWNAQGKKLFVIAPFADTITKVLPGVQVHQSPTRVFTKFLERTVTHRPDGFLTETFSAAVAQVPVS